MTIPRKPLAIMKKAEHTISALRLGEIEISSGYSLMIRWVK